jgi:uncharacterized protein YbjT (DUF2867 family)
MRKPKFLIIGGTGKTGRKVVDSLRLLGQSVRVGSRSAEIPFDWDRPETYGPALEGIDKVYITFQPDLAVPGAFEAVSELVRIAKEKGVSKLVLMSGKGEAEAERCESVIINSGLDYSIVRANWFSQNYSENFLLEPVLQGVVALPMGDMKVPYVDTGDIADVVVECLLHDEHNGKIYQLTGTERFTFPQVVELISKETGRDIQFVSVSLEEYVEVMKTMDLPEIYVWLIEYLFSHVLTNPENEVITNDIETILKRSPRSFRDYVKETAARGIWNQPKEVSTH